MGTIYYKMLSEENDMKNKKREKGFTLIELLVVVAIIGILASVGVVAYNGYTESAKKAGVASNHANIMKFVGAELAKCNIDSKTMEDSGGTAKLDCSALSTDGTVATAAAAAIASRTKEFKNPYGGATLITKVDKAAAAIGKGEISISDDGSTVTIESCKESEGCEAASTEDRLVGEVIID